MGGGWCHLALGGGLAGYQGSRFLPAFTEPSVRSQEVGSLRFPGRRHRLCLTLGLGCLRGRGLEPRTASGAWAEKQSVWRKMALAPSWFSGCWELSGPCPRGVADGERACGRVGAAEKKAGRRWSLLLTGGAKMMVLASHPDCKCKDVRPAEWAAMRETGTRGLEPLSLKQCTCAPPPHRQGQGKAALGKKKA